VVSRRTMLAAGVGTALGAVTSVAAATAATAGPVAAAATAGPRAAGPAGPAGAVPGAAGPAGAAGAIPATRSARRVLRAGRLLVEQTEFRLTHLAVNWRGPAAQVRLRTAAGWTGWSSVDGCAAGRDGREQPGRSVLLTAPAAIGYEIWVAGGGTAQVTELNTVDGPASTQTGAAVANAIPLPAGATCPALYLPRAAWGADESLRFSGGVELFPPTYYPVQTLTVHHQGAGINDDPDPVGTLRSIYYDHTVVQAWGDIGYHLLIDEAGRVYEGRWSGADPAPCFGGQPTSDGRPQMSTGAHATGWNSGNIGICLLGDFTSRLPTAAARESLTNVLASLAQLCRLNPAGVTNFVNPVSGGTKTVNTISGHRDWEATECPGNLFYPELPALRSEVARRMQEIPLRPTPRTTRQPVPAARPVTGRR
jgi:hypothetical protein